MAVTVRDLGADDVDEGHGRLDQDSGRERLVVVGAVDVPLLESVVRDELRHGMRVAQHGVDEGYRLVAIDPPERAQARAGLTPSTPPSDPSTPSPRT